MYFYTWLYLDLEVGQLLKSTVSLNLMYMNSRIMTSALNKGLIWYVDR
jgi:hypothetical protein